MPNAKVIFKGHPFNPLTQLAEALNGKKFGSNVKLDNEMLDKLNRAIAVSRLFYENNGFNYDPSRKPLEGFTNVYGTFPPNEMSDWEDLVDEKNFEKFAKDLSNELPRERKPMLHWSGQYAKSPNWMDVARNDPDVKKRCFDEQGTTYSFEKNLCRESLLDWMKDNITTEGSIPLLEDIAKENSKKRISKLRNVIIDENAKLARINVKRPQDFAKRFGKSVGVDLNTARNDAQHRINVSWRDYNNELMQMAEQDGVFLDPISFVDDELYGNLARSIVNGDIDGTSRYTLETMPEIPSNGINYKGSKDGNDEPDYYYIQDKLSSHGFGWSPFNFARNRGIVDR